MAGKIVHFELPSQDTERAKTFYSGVFDWEFGDPMGMEYWLTQTAEGQGGAIYKDDKRGMTVYFDTEDIDATLAKVAAQGGVAGTKAPIPNVGWFAHCTDTEGNDFSVFESDESVTA